MDSEDNPFRRSSRLSRSPVRGAESAVQDAGIPVPAVVTDEQPLPRRRSAVELVYLASSSSSTSKNKEMDVISVPINKSRGNSSIGSATRPLDLAITLQNDDLKSILAKMSGKTNELQYAFETKRNVTMSSKGAIMELSALNNRAIELQEGINKENSASTVATQTEPQKPSKKASPKDKVPTVQMPKVQAPKLSNYPAGRNTQGETNPSGKDSKSCSYASVAKEASTGGEWNKIKPKRLRKKPEAIIVKKTGEVSYADMLKKLKADPNLSELGKHVRKIRRTQQGELLLEVEGKASENVPKFKSDLEASLKEMASVRRGAQRVALSCCGLHEATTADDLHSCLVTQFQGILLSIEDIRGLRRMRDGTQIATVLMNAKDAITVLEKGMVTVGWSRCRIIQYMRPIRCFRCLEFGHRTSSCKSVDRSDCCLRCGEHGHKAKGCVALPKCVICSSDVYRNHATGGFACPTYKASITKGANSSLKNARPN